MQCPCGGVVDQSWSLNPGGKLVDVPGLGEVEHRQRVARCRACGRREALSRHEYQAAPRRGPVGGSYEERWLPLPA